MRTLLVSKDIVPWGPPFGAGLRLNLIASTLAEEGPVDLLVISSFSDPPPPPSDLLFEKVQTVRVPFPAGQSNIAPQALVDSQRAALLDVLKTTHWVRSSSYDLAWYNRERAWLTTRGIVPAPAVVDVDDLEDVLIERWLDLGKTPAGTACSAEKRAVMVDEIRWWREVHRVIAGEVDVLACTTESDKSHFNGSARSILLPNTYEPPGELPAERSTNDFPSILFQGLLTWPPNEDAAVRLADDIFPLIRETYPSARLVLAGLPGPRVRQLAERPGIFITGTVPSMTPYLRKSDLVVVPLRVGSGSRIKILEAFANRIPVVATRVAAEGLSIQSGIHLEIAESDSEIAQTCITLLADKQRGRQLAEEGYKLYLRRHRASVARGAVREAIAVAAGRACQG
jgi:glycosyltransferase involved in cell wall biosynthesis